MKTNKTGKGKREALREHLLDAIRLRVLKPGDKLYSRPQFMRRFRCARATVDHVITELIDNKILVGESGSGTYVAQPLNRSTGNTVAIALPGREVSTMAHQMAQGFIEGIGSELGVKFFDFGELKQPDAWEKCKANKGIAFIQADIEQAPLLAEAHALNIPHISLYRDPPESSFVSIDNYGGMAGVVNALALRGCKRIATRECSRNLHDGSRPLSRIFIDAAQDHSLDDWVNVAN